MSKIIQFTAHWCQPCKQIEPFVEKLIKEYNLSDAEFEKVILDDDNYDMCTMFKIDTIPAFVLLNEGENQKVTMKVTGTKHEEIENLFKKREEMKKMNQILKKFPISEASTVKHARS